MCGTECSITPSSVWISSILAGNLGTLLTLAGTPWFPDLDGVLLCIEDDEEETPATIDRYLTQLRLMGAFERIAGLVVGRFPPEVGFGEHDPLDQVIEMATRGFELPIAVDLDFGHTDPMFVLPNGVNATLICGDQPELQLNEGAVT